MGLNLLGESVALKLLIDRKRKGHGSRVRIFSNATELNGGLGDRRRPHKYTHFWLHIDEMIVSNTC